MTSRIFATVVLFVTTAALGQAETLALVGGSVYLSPAEEPLRDTVVLIDGQKITAVGARSRVKIPAGTKSIDCRGLTIAAGFWNSHVHFFERKWANAKDIPAAELTRQIEDMLTRFGFTSVFDLGSSTANTRLIHDRVESGEVAGPRIRFTGDAIARVNPGLPPDSIIGFMGLMKPMLREVADASEAAWTSKKILESGVDGIKLFASTNAGATLPDGVMQAAVNEAHAKGKLVFVHPNSAADVLAAVRARVDVIAHTTPRTPSDAALIAEMKKSGVALTPTLSIWKYYARHDRISAQDAVVKTTTGQLRDWIAAGGAVLFGNDLGAVEYDPSEEYALMAQAGMNGRQILSALTTTPAERFGESKRLGRIAVGFDADLVVLNGDPAQSIRAFTAVRYTLRSGRVIYQSQISH